MYKTYILHLRIYLFPYVSVDTFVILIQFLYLRERLAQVSVYTRYFSYLQRVILLIQLLAEYDTVL